MKIDIPFKSYFMDQMLDGSKTCTTRNKQYGERGDTFERWGHVFMLTNVYRLKLRDVRDLMFKAEGFAKPQDFVTVWNDIHQGRGFSPEQVAWVHEFMKGSEFRKGG